MFTKPRLLDQLRAEIRKRHFRYRAGKQYVGWVRRYVHFDRSRHPADGHWSREALRLRVKDLNLEDRGLILRDGKSGIAVRSPLD